MHQNTFLTTSDLKKYFFSGHDSGTLEVCANASKHLFNHFRPKFFCLFSGHDSGGLEGCANASKQLFNHFRPKKVFFFFQAMILVVWKYAQMHQNTFFNHFRPKKIFCFRP
jgi:hypothetical protein